MSQPTPYTPTTDFSQQESNNASGRSTVNTAALDAEFANIETTLDQTLANIQLIQRDDGKLGDVTVEVRCLAPDVLNIIGGFNLTGLWQASTYYNVNDICSNGEYTYVCKTAHMSGLSFSATNWIQFGFTSGSDAAQAAANAQVSANSALASKNEAASSASSASLFASSASSSASSANTSANDASNSASSAASSATSASNSASSAAASAASIALPLSVSNGGTGATNATNARINLGLGSAAQATLGTGFGQVPTADQVGGPAASTAQAQGLSSDSVSITPLKLKEAMQGANMSLALSGYQKLPSGLIIQWGGATIVGLAGNAITYPIAFPNALLSLTGTVENSSDTATFATAYVTSTPKTTGAFRLNNSNTRTVYWIAIGY